MTIMYSVSIEISSLFFNVYVMQYHCMYWSMFFIRKVETIHIYTYEYLYYHNSCNYIYFCSVYCIYNRAILIHECKHILHIHIFIFTFIFFDVKIRQIWRSCKKGSLYISVSFEIISLFEQKSTHLRRLLTKNFVRRIKFIYGWFFL